MNHTNEPHSCAKQPPPQSKTHQQYKATAASGPSGGRQSFASVASRAPPPAATATTNATAASATRTPCTAPAAVDGRHPKPAAASSSFTATLHVRRNFILKAPPGSLATSAAPLRDRLKAFLGERLPGIPLPITDAVLFGPQVTSTRAFFSLDTLEAANDLVGRRSSLKGSSVTVHDYLTPQELKLKRAQWPRFAEARSRGLRAQFHRARLVLG